MVGVWKWIVLALAVTLWAGCAPANPSAENVAGRWRVEWSCGVETLDLNASVTYAYTIDFAGGDRLTASGQWGIAPKTRRLEGAHVILRNALEACSAFGERLSEPARRDRELETIWEWGRTILSFNPDVQGFTRIPG